MAKFEPAFDQMMDNEGGYQLHEVPGDRGGQTYAGIARKYHYKWHGWAYIDNDLMDDVKLKQSVQSFYQYMYWSVVKGDAIVSQQVAASLFDFAVNAGHRTAIKLAQIVVGSAPDGIMGPKTLAKLNSYDQDLFSIQYPLAKIARYAHIVNRDRSQDKFLLGWINRTLKGVA